MGFFSTFIRNAGLSRANGETGRYNATRPRVLAERETRFSLACRPEDAHALRRRSCALLLDARLHIALIEVDLRPRTNEAVLCFSIRYSGDRGHGLMAVVRQLSADKAVVRARFGAMDRHNRLLPSRSKAPVAQVNACL